jgi:hypothetical protein
VALKNNNNVTQNVNDKEDNYKMLIMSKDRTIGELKSTLEVILGYYWFRYWN